LKFRFERRFIKIQKRIYKSRIKLEKILKNTYLKEFKYSKFGYQRDVFFQIIRPLYIQKTKFNQAWAKNYRQNKLHKITLENSAKRKFINEKITKKKKATNKATILRRWKLKYPEYFQKNRAKARFFIITNSYYKNPLDNVHEDFYSKMALIKTIITTYVSKKFFDWTVIQLTKKPYFKRMYHKHRILRRFILGTIFYMRYPKNTFVAVFTNDEYGPKELLFKASLGTTLLSTTIGMKGDKSTYKGTKKRSPEGPLDVAKYTGKILYRLGRVCYDIIFPISSRWTFKDVIRNFTQTKYYVRFLKVNRRIGFGRPRPQKKARK